MSSNKDAENSKATIDNVNDTVEAAMAMGKEKVEQVQENYTRAYGEFSKFGQETLGVYMKAGEILAKGAEDIGQACFKLAKVTAETNAEAAKAVFAAKTINDVVDVQNDFALESYQTLFSEGTKISELSLKVAHEAFEPLKEQLHSSMAKTMKDAST
tara:strand:- start:1830 stop:2300 length:471 start_codon:yes stop_codon:yes gene_type:complete